MKNTSLNAKMFRVTFSVAIVSGIISCNNQQKSSDMANNQMHVDSANVTNTVTPKVPVTATDTSADIKFMMKAAEINLEEIRVGRLAQAKGVAGDIKRMGMMLESDHSKALTELTAIALKKNVALPQELDNNAQSDYRDLDSQNGNDFDKKFSNRMVDGHKDAIALFEKEASQTSDADIRDYANKVLPVLHKHLDDAVKCQDKSKMKS